MSTRISVAGLQIAKSLYDLVRDEIAPGTGIPGDRAWQGFADIVRELIDGNAGWRDGNSNLPDEDTQWWMAYRDRLEQAAQGFTDIR